MVNETEQIAHLPPLVRVGSSTIDRSVLSGIREASEKTGVDFAFMLAKADRESSFRANAQNRRSSAQGLYQFTDQTWMEQIKRHGPKHGLGDLADRLHRRREGGYEAADLETLREVLALRQDPAVSAAMAAEYAAANGRYLTRRLGRAATETDVYLAHFLGPGGAGDFLQAMARAPQASAAAAFPKAARANRSIFYDANGGERSLAKVYATMERSITASMRGFSTPAGQETAPVTVPAGPVPLPPQITADIEHHRSAQSLLNRYETVMGRENMGRIVTASEAAPAPPEAKPDAAAIAQASATAPPRPYGAKPAAEDIAGSLRVAGLDDLPRPVAQKPLVEDMESGRDPATRAPVLPAPAPAPQHAPQTPVLTASIEAEPPVEPNVPRVTALSVTETFDRRNRITEVRASLPELTTASAPSGPDHRAALSLPAPPEQTIASADPAQTHNADPAQIQSADPAPAPGVVGWLRRVMMG